MIGTVVGGRYRVLDELGTGGMGVVYRARDERLDCDVAIKVLPEGMLADPDALKRLGKEARTLSKLNHPNIVSVRDFLTHEGASFLVMEFVPGVTLANRLSQGPIETAEVVLLGTQICSALEEAHEAGIVHCDLKPGNIMVTPKEQVKVLDFGLARFQTVSEGARTETISVTGALAGTVPYMAPEQLLGAKPDRRSDVYSLGVVLYEMCTGKRPFDEKTAPRLTEAILHQAPRVPSTSNPLVSSAFDSILLKALEKEPEHRYQSVRELSVDLARLTSQTSLLNVTSEPRPKRRAWILPMALVAMALAGLLASRPWGWLRRHLPTGAAPRIQSLVILPLLNATGNPEIDYLSDGISESIINSLSQLHSLRVVARSTSFNYAVAQSSRGFDPRKIGTELGVDAAVMGEVTQPRETPVIQADLVETDHGSQLWGVRYDRGAANLLAVSQDIVDRICENLGFELSPLEQTRVTKRYTESDSAYRLYLKGRYYSAQWTTDGFKRAIQTLTQAVETDPTYGLAYAGLAACFYDASGMYLVPTDAMPKAEAAARRALELDSELAEAHTVLAQVDAQYKWEWDAAERGYLKALELKPGYATAHQWYGYMLAEMGRLPEAIAELTEARSLDPLTPLVSANLAWVQYLSRQYDQSILENKAILQAHPDFPVAHYNLGLAFEQKHMYKEAIAAFEAARDLDREAPHTVAFLAHAYAISGNLDQARETLDQLKQMSVRMTVSPFLIALVYVGLGENDQAFAWLEKAADFRSEELLAIKVDPRFDGLHSDPRFEGLLRRVNLAP